VQWGRGVAAGSILLAVVYALAVWTAAGQRFEDVILESAQGRHSAPVYDVLDAITVWSLAAMVGVVVVIGLARGLPDLAVAAGGVIVCSVVTAEVLRAILTRPLLLAHGYRREDHSFPSGHTAMAVSVMCALVLVVPHRHRSVVAGLSALWAVGVGALTVAASWHRPSDTLGSDLIALIYTCTALAWLTHRGRVHPIPGDRAEVRLGPVAWLFGAGAVRRGPGRLGPVAWLFGMIAVVGGGAAVYYGFRTAQGLWGVWDPAELKLGAAVTAGRAIALTGGALTALTLLLLLRGLDIRAEFPRPPIYRRPIFRRDHAIFRRNIA
jgi:membrane-associated phospholipid phosphatase